MSSNYLKAGTVTRKDERGVSQTLIPARVVDVILDESHPDFETLGRWDSIGIVKYKVLGKSKKEENTKVFPYAYPLRSHIKQIPLKDEIVLLVAGPSQKLDKSIKSTVTYYIDVVSLWNHPHYNPYPEDTSTDPEGDVDFVTKADINPMQPFAGDVILEGRQGQSIRLSSTSTKTPWTGGTNGDPITVISNGQIQTSNGYQFITEDINRDSSSIYLTSSQTLPLKLSQTFRVFSPKQSPQGEAVITAGGLTFNSRLNNISLTAAENVGIKGVTTVLEGTREVTAEAPTIKLGATANQHVLLAETTLQFLNPVLDDLIVLCTALSVVPFPTVQLAAQNLALKVATFKTSQGFMKSVKAKAE